MDAQKTRILAMNGPRRFGFFVRSVAKAGTLWGLHDEGWAAVAGDGAGKTIPFWPDAEFAALCAKAEWARARPREITLDSFLARWVPGMTTDGARAAVFPTPLDRGVVMDPEELAQALREESEGGGDADLGDQPS